MHSVNLHHGLRKDFVAGFGIEFDDAGEH